MTRSGAGAPARATRSGAVTARRTQPAPGRAPVLASVVPTGTGRTVHIVRSGETLWQIAQQFRVSLPALLQANRLTSKSRIHAGDAIRIPG